MKSCGQCWPPAWSQYFWVEKHFSSPLFFNTMIKLSFGKLFFSVRSRSQSCSAHVPVTLRNFSSALWVSPNSGAFCLCAPHTGDLQCHQWCQTSTWRLAALHSSEELISTHPVRVKNAILTSCRPWCLGEVVCAGGHDARSDTASIPSQCFGKSTFFSCCLFGIKPTLFEVLYSSQLAK